MAGQMKMVRAGALTLRSLSGHTVKFEPNKPTMVPFPVIKEAMEKGAVPYEEDDRDTVSNGTDIITPKEPPSGDERLELLTAAMENMKVENARDDFTSGGTPKVEAVTKRVGFAVTAAEIKPIWDSLNTTGAGE